VYAHVSACKRVLIPYVPGRAQLVPRGLSTRLSIRDSELKRVKRCVQRIWWMHAAYSMGACLGVEWALGGPGLWYSV